MNWVIVQQTYGYTDMTIVAVYGPYTELQAESIKESKQAKDRKLYKDQLYLYTVRPLSNAF